MLLAWVCASVAAADDFESVRREAEKNLGSEAGADYDRWLGDFFKARPEVEKELTECVAGHDERPPLRGYVAFDRDGSYRYYMSERVVEDDPKALGPAIMAGIQAEKLEA